ncbi:hypothetical protein COL940_007313 [Colletotrichum noveboracense]|nr:hypothetical protein COL940_007313 [Colletotrichum noveboracense]KAJ0287012.1 hypothetical protein CBS470a_005592 [Colletotrichum nupharicola]
MATTAANPASVKVDSPFKIENPGGDWRDQLEAKGYCVVKGAIPSGKARYYQQKAFEWLKSFDESLDINEPSTWKDAKFPVQTDKNTYENYSVVHERFMWEARQEPGVLDAFTKVWGTDKLIVSFDSLNITLPNLKEARAPWPHVDQAPRKRGLHCIQGIINLSHAGPEDEWRDNRYFDDKDMEWFKARGVRPVKVEAEPGDLILWDSRCIHWGEEPTKKSDVVRTVIYAAYTPAELASKEALEEKSKVFQVNGATTHWPHDNIKLRDMQARLSDGTVDPRNRSEPLEKPILSDQLLRLAGVKAY